MTERLSRSPFVLLLISLLAAIVPAPAQSPREEPIRNVFWQPDNLQQGSPMFITCELSKAATRVSATWRGKRLTFFRTEKPRLWYALAGVGMDVQPGNYDLKVSALLRTGHWASVTKSVAVAAANFGEGTADVPQQYVEPNATQQQEIARDGLLKKRALTRDIRIPLWSGNFMKPVDAQPTPSFGETRLLNEEKSDRHMGTDYPIKDGSPVHAANAGVVVLARSLYYEGNCVIINHGQNLFTIYFHLSRIDVKEGARVRKDERIGLTGATGRVTGPHLHFEVLWDGSAVDPQQLLSFTLPEMTAAERQRAAHVD